MAKRDKLAEFNNRITKAARDLDLEFVGDNGDRIKAPAIPLFVERVASCDVRVWNFAVTPRIEREK